MSYVLWITTKGLFLRARGEEHLLPCYLKFSLWRYIFPQWFLAQMEEYIHRRVKVNYMDVYPNFEKNVIFTKDYSHDYSSSICERKPHKKRLIATLFTVYWSGINKKSKFKDLYHRFCFFIVELEGSFWSIMLPLSAGHYFMTLCFILYTLPFRFSKFHLSYYPCLLYTSPSPRD